MKEDNVYEETTLSESTVAVSEIGEGRKGAEQKDCAIPGKFKDVDALARAYEALQAEFTRRSQRLKELERKAENSSENGAAHIEAEKLRKNALARKQASKRFEEFLTETEELGGQEMRSVEGEPVEAQPEKTMAVSQEKMENEATVYATSETANGNVGASAEEKQVGATSVAKREDMPSSEALYAQVCRDESLRLRIIGEYLASIGKSGAPLMTGGAGAFVTPPQKAKNIAGAGDMALQYLKQQKTKIGN